MLHVIAIDVGGVEDESQLHALLARELEFPSFYGRNWDAFWDVVSGLVEIPDHLLFVGWAHLCEVLPRGAATLTAVLRRYRSEFDPDLRVEVDSGSPSGELWDTIL